MSQPAITSAGAEREAERFAAVPGGVELFPALVVDADVLDGDFVARLGFGCRCLRPVPFVSSSSAAARSGTVDLRLGLVARRRPLPAGGRFGAGRVAAGRAARRSRNRRRSRPTPAAPRTAARTASSASPARGEPNQASPNAPPASAPAGERVPGAAQEPLLAATRSAGLTESAAGLAPGFGSAAALGGVDLQHHPALVDLRHLRRVDEAVAARARRWCRGRSPSNMSPPAPPAPRTTPAQPLPVAGVDRHPLVDDQIGRRLAQILHARELTQSGRMAGSPRAFPFTQCSERGDGTPGTPSCPRPQAPDRTRLRRQPGPNWPPSQDRANLRRRRMQHQKE